MKEIVFMDEPVTFLDINYQLELMEIIKDMKKSILGDVIDIGTEAKKIDNFYRK